MSDLRERVPGHALIDELLHQWDLGTIHVDERSNGIVIDEEAEGWYRGVLGERRVAAILDQLSAAQAQSPWTVLHSVPVGRGESDIDHVVIGPPGVFTINTKFSPGKDVWVAGRGMYVGGAKQHYVVNALYEARRASTYLSRLRGPELGCERSGNRRDIQRSVRSRFDPRGELPGPEHLDASDRECAVQQPPVGLYKAQEASHWNSFECVLHFRDLPLHTLNESGLVPTADIEHLNARAEESALNAPLRSTLVAFRVDHPDAIRVDDEVVDVRARTGDAAIVVHSDGVGAQCVE